jgi:Ca2+-binding RTX toxin-like protein
MKRVFLILTLVLVATNAAAAQASERSLTVMLAGGNDADTIRIALSSDGRSYLIESQAPLEVGGTLCTHPEADPMALACEAMAIAGFEINGNGGDDTISVGREVLAPVTLRGGPGDDKLTGGGGNDKLIGGIGNDELSGRGGDDWLYGGGGDDRLQGGPGNDVLRGGEGSNVLLGGSGVNSIS